MTKRERIMAAIEYAISIGIKKARIADFCGVSRSAVSQWSKGDVENLEYDNLKNLAKVCQVSEAWLADEKGPMRIGVDSPTADYRVESNVEDNPLPVGEGCVPVKGSAQLGTQGYFEALDYPVEAGDGYLHIFSPDPDAYGLRVVGNSMMPRIKHHEYVLIEPNHDYINGDEVLVCTRDGQCMIKVYTWLRDGQYRFDSINDGDFAPLYMPQEEVERLHYVGAIVKSSRYMP